MALYLRSNNPVDLVLIPIEQRGIFNGISTALAEDCSVRVLLSTVTFHKKVSYCKQIARQHSWLTV